ncbi:MAG: PorV/PorQ family protein [Elusimicrobiota bacterium]
MRQLVLTASAMLILTGRQLWAQYNPGVTAESVLQIPLGARALGMGGAFTAVADDPEALYYNPAGISQLNSQQIEGSFYSGLAGNTLQNIAYAGPLPFSGLSESGYASFGANLVYSQDGTIQVNRTNPDGSFQSSNSLNAGSDMIAGLSYAESVGQFSFSSSNDGSARHEMNNFVGISGKYIRSTLVQQYTAQTFTGDIGYLGVIPDWGLRFGLSALNIGGSLKYIAASDPLPTTLRAGTAYTLAAGRWAKLLLAGDGEWLTHERQWYANTGFECTIPMGFAFRAGYQIHQDALGLTLGFGINWENFSLDYAWAMSGPLNNLQYATLGYRFGNVLPSKRVPGPKRDEPQFPGDEEQAAPSQEQRIQTEPSSRAPQGGPLDNGGGVPGWIY